MRQVQLNPYQDAFVFDTKHRYLLADGGRGSSKTFGGVVSTVQRADRPGAREALFRKVFKSLMQTTMKTLLEGDANTPPVLTPGRYTHNQQRKEITLDSGGVIVYGGLDRGDASKLGGTGGASSMNLTGAFIDEAVELTEGDLRQLDGSVRVPHPEIPNQIRMACNPSVPSHWLVELFGIKAGTKAQAGYRRIFHPVEANAGNLSPSFLDAMRNLTGVARERYWLGKWVGSDGLVYDTWDRNRHVREIEETPDRVVLGIDVGYRHPFVCLRGELTDGHLHISDEVYGVEMQREAKTGAVQRLGGKDAEWIETDPAGEGAEFVDHLRSLGMAARGAPKGPDSVMQGVEMVRRRLHEGTLTVSSRCTNLIREFESYEMDQTAQRERPKKEDDHSMDALRYLVMALDKHGGLAVFTGVEDPGPRTRPSVWDDPTFRM